MKTTPTADQMDSGLCCLVRHANAVPPWTCDCPCHERVARAPAWRKEFLDSGGYDSMFGAWDIISPDGQVVIKVDLRCYGQQPCDYAFRHAQAEADAECIVDALNARDLA